MGEVVLQVEHIAKEFPPNEVLRDISMEIYEGDSMALIGHNGCGKSTLLKILSGLITASSGTVYKASAKSLAYIPDRFPRLPLTPLQYLTSIAEIAGMEKGYAKKRSIQLMEDFYMDDLMKVALKNMSKGSLQKMAVIQALLVEPDILLMDEPLSGQDADSQLIFVEKIKTMNAQGTALIMACHETNLINSLGKDVYEITDGRMKRVTKKQTVLQYIIIQGSAELSEEVSTRIKQILKRRDTTVFQVEESACGEVLMELLRKGIKIREVGYEDNAGITEIL